MNYIEPELVRSPKKSVSDLNVIWSGSEGQYSVALLSWNGDKSVGMRWNGTTDKPTGNPQSRGIPTWFIIPEEISSVFLREWIQRGKISGLKALAVEEYLKEIKEYF